MYYDPQPLSLVNDFLYSLHPSPDFFTQLGYCDTYSKHLFEQEYVRIIAQEAHSKIINTKKQRPKKFECNYCSTKFCNRGQLKSHIRTHTGESMLFLFV